MIERRGGEPELRDFRQRLLASLASSAPQDYENTEQKRQKHDKADGPLVYEQVIGRRIGGKPVSDFPLPLMLPSVVP